MELGKRRSQKRPPDPDSFYQELENLRIMDVGAWIVIMGEEILRRNEVGQHRLMKITWHSGKQKGSPSP